MRRSVVGLTFCHFVLMFFSPFSIAITSHGEERTNLSAFRMLDRFVIVWICQFPLPLDVWEGLRFVVPVLVLLFVALWSILRGDLLCVFPCVILFLCFSVLLVLRLPRLGKRELILVLFVRLFGLCLFRFVGFLFLLGLERAAVCDCGTSWTFLLPFLLIMPLNFFFFFFFFFFFYFILTGARIFDTTTRSFRTCSYVL